MSEQEKKRQRIHDLLNSETKPKFFVYRIQSKYIFFFFFIEKEIF